MNTIWLTVEFSPGSDIADACRDAVALANKTGVSVHGNFNGVLLMAAPGDNHEDLRRPGTSRWTEVSRATRSPRRTGERHSDD